MCASCNFIAVEVFIGHGKSLVASHVEIVVGTLHLVVNGLAVAGTEEGYLGDESESIVAVHALDAASVDVRELHVSFHVNEFLKNLTVDAELVLARTVELHACLCCLGKVRHVPPVITQHQIPGSLKAHSLTLDLLHLRVVADGAFAYSFNDLVGTVNGLHAVVVSLIDVCEAFVGSCLQAPDVGAVSAVGTSSVRVVLFNVGVLHPYARHTAGERVFAEKDVNAGESIGGIVGIAIDERWVLLRRRGRLKEVVAGSKSQHSHCCY